MTDIGHNGGPSFDIDTDDVKMSWIKLDIADFKRGIADLNYELRGYYITLLVEMYDSKGRLPNDLHLLGKRLGTTARVIKRVLDTLIGQGKVYIDGDWLRNRRCDEEREKVIAEYCRRHAAAVKREAEKRVNCEVSEKFQRSFPVVSPKLSRNSAALAESFGETFPNSTMIAGDGAPKPHQSSAQNCAYNLESRKKKELVKNTSLADSFLKTETPVVLEEGCGEKTSRTSSLGLASIENAAVPPKRRARAEQGTRLTETWFLPKAWGEWARQNFRITDDQIRRESESFKDYWLSRTGQIAVKADWFATWRNWIRKGHGKLERPKAASTAIEPPPPKFDAAKHFRAIREADGVDFRPGDE